VKRKIRLLLRSIPYTLGLGLLTLFLVTIVFPVAAQQSLLIIQNSAVPTQFEQGIALYEAGRFSEAVTVWQQVARSYEVQGDRITQALSLSYLSSAYQDLGQWQEAQTAISQSLELLQNLQLKTQSSKLALAQALNTQGSLQLARGQTESALNTWKQAQKVYSEAGDEIGILGSQINQAQALQTLGLYRRAKTTLEQVNQKLQTQPDSLLKATGLRSLGIVLQVIGDLPKSQEVLEQSLAISQRLKSPQDISATFFSLGNTARALQDYQKAAALYQKAVENATNPIIKLESQLNLLSLSIQTEKWERAQTLFPQIQSNLSNLPPSRAAVYAQVNLAESIRNWSTRGNHLQVGKLPTAKPQNNQPNSTVTPTENGNTSSERSRVTGMRRGNQASSTVQPSSPQPPPPQQSLTSSIDIAQLLAKAVQQARMLKDLRAESYALGELGQIYEHAQQWSNALTLTQDALTLAQAVNADPITYRWQWQLGRILKQQGNDTGAVAAYTEAVNILQSLRSDLVAINADVQFSFRESVEPVYRELVGLLLQSPNSGKVPSQENLEKVRKIIESLQLAELDNFFREACLNVKPEQIDQVDPTAAVIYPIILPDRLAVILSLPGQPLSYYQTQIPQNEVESALNELLQTLSPVLSNKQRLRLSQQVYSWLIQPAEAQLADHRIKTLVFVLDGALRSIPMAALHDGKQYLVERYSIALSPGLQLLQPRSLVRSQLKALTGGLTEARQGFSSIPAVESELNQIASKVRSELLLNQEFTKTTLEKQINAVDFPVIHLATHAQFSSKAENTFLLTWDDRINVRDFDQLLRSRERQNTNPIELLVLSACQTATGDKRAALGLAGLAVRSGARSTLATLWSVQDDSTAEFMVKFYQELTQTEGSKAEAIRQAQLALLKKPKYQHPFYWAPFILVGNWL
jgi:CHAT domain-containing protein